MRLLAILIALGMLVISTQSGDVATTDQVAAFEAVDDVPPVALVQPVLPSIIRARSDVPPAQDLQPPQHRPEQGVFRPPRAHAFI